MDMDKLFKALPRDLQWEVLTEFLGTHVVRYGKLMRKIVYTMDNRVRMGHRVRQCLPWLHERHPDDALPMYIRFTTLGNHQVKFCYDGFSGDTIFCYRKIIDHHTLWEVQYPLPRAEDTITLPPFVKNVYPSYPFTTQKRRIPLVR